MLIAISRKRTERNGWLTCEKVCQKPTAGAANGKMQKVKSTNG